MGRPAQTLIGHHERQGPAQEENPLYLEWASLLVCVLVFCHCQCESFHLIHKKVFFHSVP